MKKDCYKLLGISKSATEKDIKKAFRSMAMKYHPDKNDDPGAEAKFKEISEAYSILSDSDKKATYDRFGHSGLDSASYQSPGAEDIFSSFGDIFGDLFGFGGNRQRRTRTRGRDIKYSMKINLEQVMTGGKAEIKIPRTINCNTCSGTGCAEGGSPVSCGHCRGSGFTHIRQPYINIQQTCSKCGGDGSIIKKKCKTCNGSKVAKEVSRLKVSIPVGIENNTTIRVSGKGDLFGNAYSPGDLYLTIIVNRHNLFSRSGQNIVYNLSIDYVTACIGGSVIIPTLHGNCKINIPKGTQNDDIIRLKKKGCPTIGREKSFGDQHNRVFVIIPKNISKEEEGFLKEIDKIKERENYEEPKA